MTENARIRDVNASTECESLSPLTMLDWNPTTGSGAIVFNGAWYYRTKGTEDYFGEPQRDMTLRVTMAEALALGPMNGVPPEYVIAYFKGLWDNRRNAIEQIAAVPGGETIPGPGAP